MWDLYLHTYTQVYTELGVGREKEIRKEGKLLMLKDKFSARPMDLKQ